MYCCVGSWNSVVQFSIVFPSGLILYENKALHLFQIVTHSWEEDCSKNSITASNKTYMHYIDVLYYF